jgi:hypothetical protein
LQKKWGGEEAVMDWGKKQRKKKRAENPLMREEKRRLSTGKGRGEDDAEKRPGCLLL